MGNSVIGKEMARWLVPRAAGREVRGVKSGGRSASLSGTKYINPNNGVGGAVCLQWASHGPCQLPRGAAGCRPRGEAVQPGMSELYLEERWMDGGWMCKHVNVELIIKSYLKHRQMII